MAISNLVLTRQIYSEETKGAHAHNRDRVPLSLDKLSCPQIWNIEQEKDREKEKVGGRPAKLKEKKGDRVLEREIKNKGDIFLLEEQHENFVAAVTK